MASAGGQKLATVTTAAWICATITAVPTAILGLETSRHLLRKWVASVTLYPFGGYPYGDWPWIDPVYWTLGVEMSFYALVFLLLVFGRFRILEKTALVLGSLSSAYWMVGTVVAPGFLLGHIWDRWLELSLLPYGCFFAAGVLTYVVSRDGPSPVRMLAIAMFGAAGVIEVAYRTDICNTLLASHESALVPQLILVGSLGLVLVSMRWRLGTTNPVARFLRMVGLATYPLYLFHQIVGAAVMRLVLQQGGSKYEALYTALLFCLAGSILIANILEPPIRAVLRQVLLWIGESSLRTWVAFRAAKPRQET